MGKIMISRIKSFLLMIHISKTSFDGSENYFLKTENFSTFIKEIFYSPILETCNSNKIKVLEIHPARTQMVKTQRRNH